MFKRWRTTPRGALAIIGLVLVSALVFGVEIAQMLSDRSGDYVAHVQFARDIVEKGQFAAIHILFESLIIGLKAIFSVSYEAAGWIAAVSFYILTTLILYALIRAAGLRSRVLASGIALALLLVTPITLVTLSRQNLYFGYVGINVPHNPTMVMLKPFALLLFVFTVAVLNHQVRLESRTIAISFLLILFSLFAKPNFILVLLPALFVVIGYRFYRRDRTGLKFIFVMLIIPMIVLLLIEYVAQYFGADGSNTRIIFAPLSSISLYENSWRWLPFKFILSILFPVLVYLLYWRQTIRDTALNLGWLVFLAGAGQMYLFAESGDRLKDGNFWWSAQIGLFILFVVTTLFLIRHFRDQPRWRGWLCLSIFALHVLSGVIFYAVKLYQPAMFTWW